MYIADLQGASKATAASQARQLCPPATGPGSSGAGGAGEEATSVRRGSDSEGRPQNSTSHQEESDASFAGLSTVDTKYDFN